MLLLSLGFSLFSSLAFADKPSKPCFDFETKIATPLKAAPTNFKEDQSNSKEGEQTDSASVSGTVQKPILELYQKLLDPKTIRNGNNTKIELKPVESKNYLKRFTQSIKVNPTFFLTLRWDEEWGFALKEGTADAPKSIVISYEKTSGTSHIAHLCGNIVLQSLSPTSTGVFLYQETKADRRNAEDLLKDISGTLRTLRE